MLADKSLDFENHPLDLSCLRACTKIFCCHWLSELMMTCRNMSETTSAQNVEILMSPGDQCRLSNYNFKIKFGNFKEHLFNPSKTKNCKDEVLALICQSVI